MSYLFSFLILLLLGLGHAQDCEADFKPIQHDLALVYITAIGQEHTVLVSFSP